MADVLAVRNKYRMENWSALIRECNTSGLSNREFCQQRGISEKSYYYWLRKLRNQAADTEGAKLIKLEPTAIEEDILEIRYHALLGKGGDLHFGNHLLLKLAARIGNLKNIAVLILHHLVKRNRLARAVMMPLPHEIGLNGAAGGFIVLHGAVFPDRVDI